MVMDGFVIDYGIGGLFFDSNDQGGLRESFASEMFPRRYLPDYRVLSGKDYPGEVIAWIHYRVAGDEGFRVEALSVNDRDEYHASGPVPRPYDNEAPYFFTLQASARGLVRRGYLVLTDSVSFVDRRGRTHLVLGYPHDGKSSLSAISYINGDNVLSTENTVLSPRDDGLYIVNGSRMLVYDPRIHKVYGLPWTKPDYVTRHGYHVIDLGPFPKDEYRVDDITLIHSSFKSNGLDYEALAGRKIMKTLWYFSTALIRGVDYYAPHPLNLSTSEIDEKITGILEKTSRIYEGKFNEIFGSHIEVYKGLVDHTLPF